MYARDNVAAASAGQQHPVSDAAARWAVTAFGMLADATRLRLLARLLDGAHDVTALTAAVGAARPAVSQHLAKLRLAGLVTVRRDGRRAVYAVAGPHVHRLVTEALFAAEHQLSDRPAHHEPAVSPGRQGGEGLAG
jgi:DNA-binding transcriptional ArsR family regulator